MAEKPPVIKSPQTMRRTGDEELELKPAPGSQMPPPAKPAPPRAAASVLPLPAVAEQLPLHPADNDTVASESERLDLDRGEKANSFWRSFVLFNALPSWLISAILHAAIVLILAMVYIPAPALEIFREVILNQADEHVEELEEFVDEEIEQLVEFDSPTEDIEPVDQLATFSTEISVSPTDEVAAAALNVNLSDIAELTGPPSDLLGMMDGQTGSGLSGRSVEARGKHLRQAGGTDASEAAVALALQWFSKHQRPDGGWSFDHRGGRCQGRCKNHGTLDSARIGATAMALLPFLGAGQTHQEGKYQEQVRRGLYFLVRSMTVERGQLGKLWEPGGSMYSQGLATITLCEAYGMTQDEELMVPAQMALNYLMWAQYSTDGGWRYSADQAIERGDTSVVGWALMGLKSGDMAYLTVSEESFRGASRFLDSVQSNGGTTYGYTDPGGSAGSATTAIGLLCRMYLGWKRDNEALQQGVKALGEHGPAETNLYYNYYATQVLRHYGGPLWEKWNEQMREHLIVTQDKRGHPAGSWHLPGGHAGSGGRHYCTSMATMILEVYYRHLPIFRSEATADDFSL
ncbi:MAG: hypothetical protein CMJ81_12155 [Planctomycetaceae bacterium]|nr:hypothetical protein [Planctomycetaceae bacterium]